MSGAQAKLQRVAVESTAIVLTERLDALAAALRAAGVSSEQSASLLASAASATMHALMLDAILDEQPKPVARPEPSTVAEPAVPEPAVLGVPVAA
jgi:hypothetical protein